MKILKGLFIFISVLCIGFTCFFAYSYMTGRTAPILFLGHQIAKMGKGVAGNSSSAATSSTINTLTSEYGLSTSQAQQAVEIAESLGVDTSNPKEVDAFIAKNSDKIDDAQALVEAVQSGRMSEAEAYSRLAGMLDV